MALDHVEFSGEITRVAEALGRVPVPHQVGALEQVLRTAGEIDAEAGTVFVAIDGERTDIGAFL